jgi:hypothetical protein
LDDARIALILSVADLYFDPVVEDDKMILSELSHEFPMESVSIMGLEQGRGLVNQAIAPKLLSNVSYEHTTSGVIFLGRNGQSIF